MAPPANTRPPNEPPPEGGTFRLWDTLGPGILRRKAQKIKEQSLRDKARNAKKSELPSPIGFSIPFVKISLAQRREVRRKRQLLRRRRAAILRAQQRRKIVTISRVHVGRKPNDKVRARFITKGILARHHSRTPNTFHMGPLTTLWDTLSMDCFSQEFMHAQFSRYGYMSMLLGSEQWGLRHILARHLRHFLRCGVTPGKVSRYIKRHITQQPVVWMDGQSFWYELLGPNGRKRRIRQWKDAKYLVVIFSRRELQQGIFPILTSYPASAKRLYMERRRNRDLKKVWKGAAIAIPRDQLQRQLAAEMPPTDPSLHRKSLQKQASRARIPLSNTKLDSGLCGASGRPAAPRTDGVMQGQLALRDHKAMPKLPVPRDSSLEPRMEPGLTETKAELVAALEKPDATDPEQQIYKSHKAERPPQPAQRARRFRQSRRADWLPTLTPSKDVMAVLETLAITRQMRVEKASIVSEPPVFVHRVGGITCPTARSAALAVPEPLVKPHQVQIEETSTASPSPQTYRPREVYTKRPRRPIDGLRQQSTTQSRRVKGLSQPPFNIRRVKLLSWKLETDAMAAPEPLIEAPHDINEAPTAAPIPPIFTAMTGELRQQPTLQVRRVEGMLPGMRATQRFLENSLSELPGKIHRVHIKTPTTIRGQPALRIRKVTFTPEETVHRARRTESLGWWSETSDFSNIPALFDTEEPHIPSSKQRGLKTRRVWGSKILAPVSPTATNAPTQARSFHSKIPTMDTTRYFMTCPSLIKWMGPSILPTLRRITCRLGRCRYL